MLDEWFSETFPELSRARNLESVFDSWDMPSEDRRAIEIVKKYAEMYQDCPGIRAGLWLYAGDWETAHLICQSDESATGSWWHAILHRFEGDAFNSKYWYRRAVDHPVRDLITFDPQELVEYSQGKNEGRLYLQKEEFFTLLRWCVENRK